MKFGILALALTILSCGSTSISQTVEPRRSHEKQAIPVYGVTVVRKYPHDKDAFTQGLAYQDGFLYETTGHYGYSTLRKVDLKTGKVLLRHKLPDNTFAEGMAILGDNVYQLTWKDQTGSIYKIDNFQKTGEFYYGGSGWGFATNGKNFFLSDGTHVIRVLDPKTFKIERTISVYDENGKPLSMLNELEFIGNELWANVWRSEETNRPNYIARINPETGKLNSWLNLRDISPKDSGKNFENSLNGIAYDPQNNRIFVTGKNWKNLFEIRVNEEVTPAPVEKEN
ncbi:MAG: glutaminyl-peptide cyclotransferase [Pyrinomonadaceae bacterium]